VFFASPVLPYPSRTSVHVYEASHVDLFCRIDLKLMLEFMSGHVPQASYIPKKARRSSIVDFLPIGV